MLNKNLHLRVFALIFLFCFMAIGNLQAKSDNRLNGKWAAIEEGMELEFRLNNGNFEASIDGVPFEKGNYTANSGTITFNITHIYGANLLFVNMGLKLDSKWYTANELIVAVRPIFTEKGLPEKEINNIIHEMILRFNNDTRNYSVDANTLILTDNDGAMIFNKK